MKKILLFLLKVFISLAILGFLVFQAMQAKDAEGSSVFLKLSEGEKNWGFLAAGAFFTFFAVFMTILRWQLLVRVQGLPVKCMDTLRIGFIGYLFNLAPMGIVGGDLLKAWLLTKRQKAYDNHAGTKILASIFMDRIIGLYALFILASAGLFLSGTFTAPNISPVIFHTGIGVCALAVIGTVAFFILLGPDVTDGKTIRKIGTIPRIGAPVEKLILYIRQYQNHLGTLFFAILQSVLIHILFSISIFFLMLGIFNQSIPFLEMLWVSPTCMSASAIPLPCGPYEVALDFLLAQYPGIIAGYGLVLALAYRLVTLLVASLGVIFYFSAKKEIREVVKEHSLQQEQKTPE
ncbi:MAG: lysylphosphatidylglycerol synthase transmembrane domain-containing protein [Planctomycetia bacterium]|nr:lysylphosphatidylglycerol synthase transmembrane domain-containing protein [Planctomycetia bacterium]